MTVIVYSQDMVATVEKWDGEAGVVGGDFGPSHIIPRRDLLLPLAFSMVGDGKNPGSVSLAVFTWGGHCAGERYCS